MNALQRYGTVDAAGAAIAGAGTWGALMVVTAPIVTWLVFVLPSRW